MNDGERLVALAQLEQAPGEMRQRLASGEGQRAVVDDLRLPQQLDRRSRLAARPLCLREEDPQTHQRARPDIVFVGLGFPKQEHLILRLRPRFPSIWFVSCGISLSYVSGDVTRAPSWAQHAGLEWLFRLAQEPRRLARRYLVDGLPFCARLLASSAWKRLLSR